MHDDVKTPQGNLTIRTLAMPSDANPDHEIFGGWIVSQMDLAGVDAARQFTNNRLVTVAIHSMSFISPVHIGDVISCYTKVAKMGRTSITIQIETWAKSPRQEEQRLVTEGRIIYVALDVNGFPVPIQKGAADKSAELLEKS
jgi:acyl-CoA thioesterase YciA